MGQRNLEQLDLSDALKAAKTLIGYKLIHETPEGITSGIIVETEAYMADDPASHTFTGPTARNAVMFGPAGHAYVYFTYGMHYCFNIVTGKEGEGQGVLIRALEPVEGVELMMERRGLDTFKNLTNGPGKLVQAMGISMKDYGTSILSGRLRIEPGIKPAEVVQTTRVGIKKAIDHPWRFYIKDNPYVSKVSNL